MKLIFKLKLDGVKTQRVHANGRSTYHICKNHGQTEYRLPKFIWKLL